MARIDPKPHAQHGVSGDLPQTSHHHSRRSSRALSLPGGSQRSQGCGSGLGHGHPLYPAAERVPLPGGDRGSLLQELLSWKLSISLDTEFCLNALEMALGGGRTPEIFHCDQGCQFISCDYVARLQAEEIRTSWSALAGTLISASPASHGGTAMEGPQLPGSWNSP
jgi:transposase InsO family protein